MSVVFPRPFLHTFLEAIHEAIWGCIMGAHGDGPLQTGTSGMYLAGVENRRPSEAFSATSAASEACFPNVKSSLRVKTTGKTLVVLLLYTSHFLCG